LLVAVVGTQLVATLIAVYGLFMHPLVWGYALGMFLIQDRVKLVGYRVLERLSSGPAAMEVKN
jgi:H+-transporting ATPase